MKKFFLALVVMGLGFVVFAQSKVVQKSTFENVNVRWIHNEKSGQDYIELCRSPKFDEVVYRFVVEAEESANSNIEGFIPRLESFYKILSSTEIKTVDSYLKMTINSASCLYDFGIIYEFLLDCCDNVPPKKFFNLDWCTCLIVYENLDLDYLEIEDLFESIELFD